MGGWAELGYTVVTLILCAIIFLGFYSFSGYAWYCLMGYLGVRALMDVAAMAIYLLLSPETLSEIAASCISDIGIQSLIALYYIKRKPLFFPQKYSSTPTAKTPIASFLSEAGERSSPLQGTLETASPAETPLAGVPKPEPVNQPPEPVGTPLAGVHEAANPPAPVMNYCMNCGKKLKPDYSFCPNCGTPRYIP